MVAPQIGPVRIEGPPGSTQGPPRSVGESCTKNPWIFGYKWLQTRKESKIQKNGTGEGTRSPPEAMFDSSVKLVNVDGVDPGGVPSIIA